MKVSGSFGTLRRALARRLAVATAAAGIMVSAIAGAAFAGSGIVIGAPASGSDDRLRAIGGEADPVGPMDEPHRFYTELVLMRAQMRLGRELYRVGDREAGASHFIAPEEAHLPIVRAALMDRGLERVVERVEDLAAAARETDSLIDVQDLYATTRMALRRAQREVEPSIREDAAFQVRILLAMSERAIRQFEAAIDGDAAVVDPLAYRVSWAYVQQGERLLDTFEGLLRMSDAARYGRLEDRYRDFADLWPGRTPPERVDVQPDELRAELDSMSGLVAADGG
jgi:hypothetical protein